ncbi:MAG: hypothetical protein LBR53_10810 [Deltaproteobacteria bacterium]|jgi:trigger factor|nr:hypothetical protein [Deltaproteobacteria bacterium]
MSDKIEDAGRVDVEDADGADLENAGRADLENPGGAERENPGGADPENSGGTDLANADGDDETTRIDVAIEEIDPTTKKITLRIPYSLYKDRHAEIVAKIVSGARIKGFRKGKLPMELIQRYYGTDIRSQVLTEIVNPILTRELDKSRDNVTSSVLPVSLDFAEGKDLEFTGKFEVMRYPELPDFSALVYKRLAVLDEEVEKEVENLYAKFVETECAVRQRAGADHEIDENDIVSYRDKIIYKGKEVLRKKGEDVHKEVPIAKLSDAYKSSFLGRRLGEEFEITTVISEKYKNRAVAGKEVLLRLTIIEVDSVVKMEPEVFLKQFGENGYSTVEEFKEFYRQAIRDYKYNFNETNVREKILNELGSGDNLSIPSGMLERHFFELAAAYKRTEFEKFQSLSEMEADVAFCEAHRRIIEKLKILARRLIGKRTFINQVKERHNIAVTAEDITQNLEMDVRESYPQATDEMVKASVAQNLALWKKNPEYLSRYQEKILAAKVAYWLSRQVTIEQLTQEETRVLIREEEERQAAKAAKRIEELVAAAESPGADGFPAGGPPLEEPPLTDGSSALDELIEIADPDEEL